MVLDMDDAARSTWIKDVTSNDAKTIRRMDDLLEATYQRYRAELKSGRDLSDEAKRLQIRKDIENDPTWKSTVMLPRISSPIRNWKSVSLSWRNGKTRSR
jgi:hypothetical protein